MKNTVIKKITKIIITIVQVLILVAPLLLQYLSDKKMGVKRYLVFKKTMFSKEIFTSNIILAFKIMLILGSIICIFLLLNYFLKKINNTSVKSLLKVTLLNMAAAFCVFSKNFEELLAYHFFLVAIFVIIVLQYIKAVLDYKKVNNC
jgi:hypothetical protein